MTGLESCPRRADRVVARQVPGTAVLLNPNSREYFALDDVGARAWELFDGTRKVSDISSILGQEYDAPAETIRADLVELLEDLASEKLVISDW